MPLNKTPFFSILIPTKGRPHQLRFALESLRNQTFEDFEAIILDSDPTSDTARAYFGGWQSWLDGRFKYVRTGDVWMSENIQRGLAHVRGRYLHVCQDKAIIARQSLALVHEALQRDPYRSLVFELVSHVWEDPHQFFFHDRPGHDEVQRQPEFHYATGMPIDASHVSSAAIIDEFLVEGWSTICFKAPRAFNCFTSMECVEEVGARGVELFGTTSPDLCSALRLLDHLDGFHVSQAQLASHYWGGNVSFGTSWRYGFGYATDAFAKLDPKVLEHLYNMPMGLMPLFHNGIFGDYVHMRAQSYGNLKGTQLRSEDYFAKLFEDVESLLESAEQKAHLRAIVERTRSEFDSQFI